MTRSSRSPLLLTISAALIFGCGEEPPPVYEGPTLPFEKSAFVVPSSQADESNPEGHWAQELRSVAMDSEDILIIRNSTEEVNGKLGKLTLNLPLLSRVTNEDCVTQSRAQMIEPLAVLTQELTKLRQEGLTIDELIVNVELLTPKRTGIYHVCLPNAQESFFHPDHRAHILKALRELAGAEEVSAVTVGVDLNAYYHLKDPLTELSYRWDYANLISLYQEAYDEMKSVNDALLIGPGFSWTRLLNQTLPEVAEELSLSVDDPGQRDVALEVALQRTVWSALTTVEGELKADFVGVSLTPNPSEAPFEADPRQEQAVIDAHYARVGLMGAPLHPVERTPLEVLPLAFPQVDWTSPNNANANGKAPFIERLKVALRHIRPLFVSWLRLSDLPVEPSQSSICSRFTSEPKSYPESFCYSALFNSNGVPREAWEHFTTNPQ